jgi:hypothetical protein
MTIFTQTLNVEKENEKYACTEKMSNPQKSFRGSTHAWNLKGKYEMGLWVYVYFIYGFKGVVVICKSSCI